MVQTLQLTNGAVTIDFLNDPAYRITAWPPAVTKRRNAVIGSRGPFEEVVERITLDIHSTDAVGKLEDLYSVLSNSDKWRQGTGLLATLFKYEPTNLSGVVLSAPLLGAPGNAPMVTLPPSFINAPTTTLIEGVTISFSRVGTWLGEDDDVSTGAVNTHPITLTATFGENAPFESPTTVRIEDIPAYTLNNAAGSFLVVSSGSGEQDGDPAPSKRILVLDAAGFANGVGMAAVSDAAHFAKGNILRYTPADLFGESGTISIGTDAHADARRWGALLNYRNNSTTTTFRMRVSFAGEDGLFKSTPYTVVPPDTSGHERITNVFMGSRTIGTRLEDVSLSVEAVNGTAGTIDFDTLIVMALDDPVTDRVIQFGEANSATSSADFVVELQHRVLTHPEPSSMAVIGIETVNPFYTPLPTFGDRMVFTKGQYVSFAWLSRGGTAGDNYTYWRVVTTASAQPSIFFTATRNVAHPTPK